MKLVLIFGIWLNPFAIANLEESFGFCKINFMSNKYTAQFVEKPCDVVAAEINKKAQ